MSAPNPHFSYSFKVTFGRLNRGLSESDTESDRVSACACMEREGSPYLSKMKVHPNEMSQTGTGQEKGGAFLIGE